jgi:PTS system mannose-specific IIB component
MIWFRIDNRLVHGQIIEAWLPYIKASNLVIANDELAGRELLRQIMLMAVPSRVQTVFLPLGELPAHLAEIAAGRRNALVLFADCADARRAFEAKAPMEACNVGNLHYAEGKKRICPHVALSLEDENNLRYLEGQGVHLDFRCIPADSPALERW